MKKESEEEGFLGRVSSFKVGYAGLALPSSFTIPNTPLFCVNLSQPSFPPGLLSAFLLLQFFCDATILLLRHSSKEAFVVLVGVGSPERVGTCVRRGNRRRKTCQRFTTFFFPVFFQPFSLFSIAYMRAFLPSPPPSPPNIISFSFSISSCAQTTFSPYSHSRGT